MFPNNWKQREGGCEMKRAIGLFLMVFLGVSVVFLSPLWGQVKNLSLNKEVTAKTKALDKEFFKGFDVYTAGTDENPSALLFDIKDNYTIADRLWGRPLNEREIIYAIHRLDDQYINRQYNIPFAPQALNIVNVKGEVLGYVYTGATKVVMDRKKDGRVTVYLIVPKQRLEKESRGRGSDHP
jgi:hypothetical protein